PTILVQTARVLNVAIALSSFDPDRSDDDVGPDTLAILANSPARSSEAPVAKRCPKGMRRLALLAIFGRVEAGEMLPDNLVRLIALELFGARVPASDHARRVDHVDRVIGYALKQQICAAGTQRHVRHVLACPSP